MCKGPEVGHHHVFKEQQGGRCGWSRVSEGGREGRCDSSEAFDSEIGGLLW